MDIELFSRKINKNCYHFELLKINMKWKEDVSTQDKPSEFFVDSAASKWQLQHHLI